MDWRGGWRQGGARGPAIEPGDVAGSLLIHAVQRRDEDMAMPPDQPLPAEAVRVLERWVQMGAPDPRDKAKVPRSVASAESLWSLQPLRQLSVPAFAGSDWPRREVDAFLWSVLREKHLTPAIEASPEVLARRLWLVVLGIPPSPDELVAFVEDLKTAEDAEGVLAKWVDQLLASPRFGEKWARHWLDLARYAESNGKALNNGLPYAWRYRDWVIDAINADKPYDDFLTEQLAGDLLPARSQAERDSLHIATGFLAIGSKEQFGGCGNRSLAEVQPEWVDDQLNVLGRGILGINVACSRCHDHKFDPVPQRDYYALAGIFFSTEILSGRKGGKAPEFNQIRIFDPDSILLGDPGVAAELQRVEKQLNSIHSRLRPLQTAVEEAEGEAREQVELVIKSLSAEADALSRCLPTVDWAFGIREAGTMVEANIRIRGVWNRLGEAVPRGVLSAVKIDNSPTIPAESSGRLELAQWLTSTEHPLTARVFVNRIWHHVFGQGLVTTTDNFGMNGDRPSHPELLDFLAHRFMHVQQWSLKKLVRELVLSRAFRQTSSPSDIQAGMAVDPANRMLWRMMPRRIDAEAIRDSLLASSDQLEYAPRRGTAPLLMEKLFGGINQKDISRLRAEESLVRHRAIYLAIIRNETLDETLAVFDFPNNDEPVTQRETATGPSQTLLLMNHPLVIYSADRLADSLRQHASTEAGHIRLAFLRVLGRTPTAEELSDGLAFLRVDPDSLPLLCQALFQSAEFRILP